MTYVKRLSFIAEWYHEEAAIVKTFVVCFYRDDNAIEVFDQRTKKTFLRRTKMQELREHDFFVGSKINVFGRQFDIVDYADEITKNTLAKYRKKTFVLLKQPLWSKHFAAFLAAVNESKININYGIMVQFTPKLVTQFLSEKAGDVVLMNELLSGPAIALELIGDNAVEVIRQCQTQSKDGFSGHLPEPLVALFEREEIRNGMYCSGNDEEAETDIKFFQSLHRVLLKDCEFKNSTLALIKPHCIKEGNLSKVVDGITTNGFKITALRMILMARINCEEFYEVYRGILPEYIQMVAQLASGVCMCLEVVSTDETKNTFDEFRNLCGPMDPEIAKLLRPHTLRAKYGINKVNNAIHCTDLFDDTNLELQYIFKILD